MPNESKITEAEKEVRVSRVFTLISTGLNRRDILQYASSNTEWNVSNRQIDNYIHEATELFKEMAKVDREKVYGIAIERLNKLYADSLKIKDYKTCLAVQKEINEMSGLMVITHEIKGETTIHVTIGDDEF